MSEGARGQSPTDQALDHENAELAGSQRHAATGLARFPNGPLGISHVRLYAVRCGMRGTVFGSLAPHGIWTSGHSGKINNVRGRHVLMSDYVRGGSLLEKDWCASDSTDARASRSRGVARAAR